MLLLLRYCFRAGEIRLFAAWLDEQRQRGKTNGYHARANGANGLQVDHRDAYQQTNDGGDQPHKPYNGAEGMECATRFLVATNERKCCPARTEEHENNGKQTAGAGLGTAACRCAIVYFSLISVRF